MNVERTNDEVKFVDLGITLSAHDFNEIREYVHYLDRIGIKFVDLGITLSAHDFDEIREYVRYLDRIGD